MAYSVLQGDILKIENIPHPVLVVSKDFFNQSGEVIGCPIIEDSMEGPLHIKIDAKHMTGYAHCEKLKLLDLSVRGSSKLDEITFINKIDITDAIQSIFDYI